MNTVPGQVICIEGTLGVWQGWLIGWLNDRRSLLTGPTGSLRLGCRRISIASEANFSDCTSTLHSSRY
jgi:hypothetical protein